MEPETTLPGAPAVPPAAEAPASPPASEASTSEPLAGLTDDHVRAYLKDHPTLVDEHVPERTKHWGHDEWKKVDHYNRQLKREMDQKDAQARKAAEENLQLASDYQAWENARVNNRELFDSQMQNPQAAAYYAKLVAWKQRTGAGMNGMLSPDQLADRWVENARNRLSDHPELGPVVAENWDELMKTANGDPGAFLYGLITAGTSNYKKQLDERTKAEVKAQVSSALAARNLSIDDPEAPAGGIVGGGLTLDAYNRMTPADRRELRRTNPAAVDQMMSDLQK